MICHLHITGWTGVILDRKATVKTKEYNKAKEDSGAFSKKLVTGEEFKKIGVIAAAARVFRDKNSLPWDKRGGNLLPAKNFLHYAEGMTNYRDEYEEAVDAFIEHYGNSMEANRDRLGLMFDIKEYPSVAELRAKYRFEISYSPIADPDDFRLEIDENDKAKIKDEYRDSLKESYKGAVNHLWEEMRKVVGHMADKLSDKDSKFRNSLVENLTSVCDMASRLNVSEDPNIDVMVDKIKKELTAFAPDVLRHDKDARKQTAEKAQEVLDKLEDYIL